ncbi:hypothetical protein SLS60_012099 [Paraconiothyrium brasiliense]|uniref:Uncharacterized protein n=1 Tax=Paraconiothyrium brasiliense TaxID=300254 RepID=A0ABR3QGQ9_9PLEO
MAALNAQNRRMQKLISLGITYPVWLFDPDEPPWPRKLASLLPGSRPAQVTGFLPWHWEYGTDLRTHDDPLPVGPRTKPLKDLSPIDNLLARLHYDDGFSADTFRIIFANSEVPGGRESIDLADWIWDVNMTGYIKSNRIIRIERRWDKVGFWDREKGIELFNGQDGDHTTSYGFASLVKNDADLVFATGVTPKDEGEGLRRAEFELLGDESNESEICRGIVYPRRYHGPGDHGIVLRRGPKFLLNERLLIGTALEGRDWKDVERYRQGEMRYPLV